MPSPEPYRVELAKAVERGLQLLEERAAAGLGQQFSEALEKIYRILRIYPQYGEPRRKLRIAGQTVYTFCAFVNGPLYVEYIIDESNRRVYVTTPFKVVPHAGFE